MVGNRPRALRVLRVCSVFEAPPASLTPRAVSFDPIGGMQNHTGQLTRALVELGVRQVIVTSRPPGAARCSRSRSVRVLRHGVHVPWARQLWAPLAATAALREARGADLVHAHVGEDVAVLPLALAAARVAAVPLVVTVHMSVRHTYLAAGLRGRQLKLLGGAAETTVVRRADAVIALTPRLAARMVADGIPAERLHVIPSGVTASDFAAAVGDPFPGVPRPRVLFVGRLHRQKGVGTLIEAAARLRTPGAQLIVVGDGPERAAGEAAARRLGLTRRVHFTGFAPHGRVPALMRHADVFVMPSLYEELGSALVEAMQAGLPIVASRTGGIPETVGAAAALVAPGDPAALAAALDRLLGDRAAAARMADEGRRRARRYQWDELAREVMGVYHGALAAPAPAWRRDAPPARRDALDQPVA